MLVTFLSVSVPSSQRGDKLLEWGLGWRDLISTKLLLSTLLDPGCFISVPDVDASPCISLPGLFPHISSAVLGSLQGGLMSQGGLWQQHSTKEGSPTALTGPILTLSFCGLLARMS